MTTTPLANVSQLSAAQPGKKDATPADWMAFSQLMGWPIAAMSAKRPVKFILSSGEEIHVTNQMRLDIIAAINKGA